MIRRILICEVVIGAAVALSMPAGAATKHYGSQSAGFSTTDKNNI